MGFDKEGGEYNGERAVSQISVLVHSSRLNVNGAARYFRPRVLRSRCVAHARPAARTRATSRVGASAAANVEQRRSRGRGAQTRGARRRTCTIVARTVAVARRR